MDRVLEKIFWVGSGMDWVRKLVSNIESIGYYRVLKILIGYFPILSYLTLGVLGQTSNLEYHIEHIICLPYAFTMKAKQLPEVNFQPQTISKQCLNLNDKKIVTKVDKFVTKEHISWKEELMCAIWCTMSNDRHNFVYNCSHISVV